MTEARAMLPELPVGSVGHRASGWWGMLMLIATEAALFAYLLFSYYYLATQTGGAWPPAGPPSLRLALPSTLILLVSSLAVWAGERAIANGDRRGLSIGLGVALALGALFAILQAGEWASKPFTWTSGAYGSLYFTITGFHMLHLAIGLIVFVALLVWTALGYVGAERHAAVSIGAIYWHFVNVVWLPVFATLYVAPYLA